MSRYLKDIIKKHKSGRHAGIYSVCSASDWVLKAALNFAKQQGTVVLIESTANQVNQFGGYTGMQPHDFAQHVHDLARDVGLAHEQVLLGGDHLGPVVWANEPETVSMQKARDLIQAYIRAGYQKIHIDTSMRLKEDDRSVVLSGKDIARRAAELFAAAYDTLLETGTPEEEWPSFVIGSEVPVPGGAQESELHVQVTKPEDLETTVQEFKTALHDRNLDRLWRHIIAIVVQPGVEFNDTEVRPYNRKEAEPLMQALKHYPGLVFEGHSTDYQPAYCLREMVEDGVCVLKVGPALTFALREALLALDMIETEWFNVIVDREATGLRYRLETLMQAQPSYWAKYYQGTPEEKRFKWIYSLSDRIRYYLPLPEVRQVVSQLLNNLRSETIPFSLMSQYMPVQASKIRNGLLSSDPEALILDYISEVLWDYQRAISPGLGAMQRLPKS